MKEKVEIDVAELDKIYHDIKRIKITMQKEMEALFVEVNNMLSTIELKKKEK